MGTCRKNGCSRTLFRVKNVLIEGKNCLSRKMNLVFCCTLDFLEIRYSWNCIMIKFEI